MADFIGSVCPLHVVKETEKQALLMLDDRGSSLTMSTFVASPQNSANFENV
jgi:hypothetical protein